MKHLLPVLSSLIVLQLLLGKGGTGGGAGGSGGRGGGSSAPAGGISKARGDQLILNYGQTYKFNDATRNQVNALRPVANVLDMSISQTVKYMDAAFAFRSGRITREEFDYIVRRV